MSAAASPSVVPIGSLELGVCSLSGRVVGTRRVKTQNGPLFLTLLKLPAPDEYESPQTIEVQSSSALLAEVGETVKLKVRIGGRPRSWVKEHEDGRTERVHSAEVRLTFVA